MPLLPRPCWAALAVVVAVHAWSWAAHAHSSGQPSGGCAGCHSSGDYTIALQTAPASFSPGDAITVTLTISAPGGSVAGAFVEADAGTLSTIGGQGLALVNQGLTHTSPKPLQGGSVSFGFGWTAPDRPGAVRFEVSTLVGNGNGSSSGDQADFGAFDFVYGCSPFTYFLDADHDGYGQDDEPRIDCVGTTPPGHSELAGDCNDNSDQVHPNAQEVCNAVDDDCDGTVDEDAIPLDLYLDADGDGYYSATEKAMGVQGVGCVPADGLAGYPGDCAPDDPNVHPDAEEICNLVDDDCDEHVDEKVRPRCGEGWCTREATTCDPSSCIPGDPTPELCNLLDDDCDGLVDEGEPCGPGLVCTGGACIGGDAPDAGAGAPGAGEGDAGGDGCAVGDGAASPPAAIASVLVGALLLRRRRQRAPYRSSLR